MNSTPPTPVSSVRLPTFDATCDLLTGGTINSARRSSFWLVLSVTDKHGITREVHLTARTVRGQGHCDRCGEDRLVDTVTDARGVRGYCTVCSHEWVIS